MRRRQLRSRDGFEIENVKGVDGRRDEGRALDVLREPLAREAGEERTTRDKGEKGAPGCQHVYFIRS